MPKCYVRTMSGDAPTTFMIANIYNVTEEALNDSNSIWNTGLNMANGEVATLPLKSLVSKPEIDENSFELRLFRTNEFVTLIPGDMVMIRVSSPEEIQYFMSFKDKNAKVFIEGSGSLIDASLFFNGEVEHYPEDDGVLETGKAISPTFLIFGEEMPVTVLNASCDNENVTVTVDGIGRIIFDWSDLKGDVSSEVTNITIKGKVIISEEDGLYFDYAFTVKNAVITQGR